MPVHDWTRVEAGIFHDFHTVWIGNIRTALNDGLLPNGYYALAEQHAGRPITDVLTLHASPAPLAPLPLPPATGGIAVAEKPPQTQRKQVVEPAALTRRRTVAIRHVTGHRLIALVEIVSPANKDRPQHVADFVGKVVSALDVGVHVLVLDLFPPSLHNPHGMHEAICQRLEDSDEPYDLPEQSPLTLASYVAGPRIDIHLEHLAPRHPLPDMPLFIRPDRYVYVPLEATYQAAYHGMPEFWRDVLEGKTI
jgi:hypothetical protein